MPKTKEEKETLGHFKEEYGGDHGEQVYYALRNKNKKFDRSQGGGFSSKKAEWWVSRIIKLPTTIKSNVLGSLNPTTIWTIDCILQVLGKAQHEGHLVTDEKGNKHLPTSSNGKPNHRLMGAAWAALHEGYRGNKYSGPNKSQAISKLKRLYAREGMKVPSEKGDHTR